MSDTHDLLPLDVLLARVAGGRTVLVAVSDAHSTDYEATRSAAVALAVQLDAVLVLVDRSQVTLGDTPHSEGPFTDERARATGRGHLVEQAEEARRDGVREVELWATSMPTVAGVGEVATEVRPDVIVIPASMSEPSLVERITLRHLPEKVAESTFIPARVIHLGHR